jgi:hypothetical protein
MNRCARYAVLLAALFGPALAACSGSVSHLMPAGSGSLGSTMAPVPFWQSIGRKPRAVTVQPAAIDILAAGAGGAMGVTVREKNYTGTFTETTTCNAIATASPTSGKGPTLSVKVTGLKPGKCAVTFADASKHKSAVVVTVTTTSLMLEGPLPSARNAAVKIGAAAARNVALTACTNGCSIPVPAAPGKDSIGVTIVDASSHVLAIHAPAPVQIAGGKNNVVAIDFVKKIASLKWGPLPTANAGTKFLSAKAVAITASDADGNTIVGTYSNKIALANSDVSSASVLTVSGGLIAKSTDKVTLAYSGLAIAPATFTASSAGVAPVKVTFAPALSAIVYAGATSSSSKPEIDLYSTTPATNGFSGAFTATQTGWTPAPFGKPFTYTFAPIAGNTNDCPTAANPAFAVSPASGAVGTSFTVSVSSALQAATNANPYAGECLMTLEGGAGKTIGVVLTFTTSGVVIGKKRAPKR